MNYIFKIIHNTNHNGVILLIIYSLPKFVQSAPFQNSCTNPGHTNLELTNPGQYKNIGQCKIWTGKSIDTHLKLLIFFLSKFFNILKQIFAVQQCLPKHVPPKQFKKVQHICKT